MRLSSCVVWSLGLLAVPRVGSAQEVGGEAAPAPPVQASPGTPGNVGGQSPSIPAGPPSISPIPGPAGGADLDAHLPSSSRSLTDISQGDSFDLGNYRTGDAVTIKGNPDAPGILADEVQGSTGVYLVKRGDTLSSISQGVYGQPWMWPKLWSVNPQIQNPHWIYPGDQVRLSGNTAPAAKESRTLGALGFQGLTKAVPPSTVFLRQLGYIDDPKEGILGELVGAHEPVQLMSEGNIVYLVIREGQRVEVGQSLTVFRPSRRPPSVKGARKPPGEIIAIKGTIKIDKFDPETRIARGRIVESLDIIERGAHVGRVERAFDVVAPRKASENVSSRVLTSMYPHVLMGQHQVVFIDKGHNDGLERGNRLFVIRRGDTWRRTLDTASSEARASIKLDSAESLQFELAPLRGDEQKFPEEVVAELRVIETHKFSAFAVITESKTEVLPGDRAVARSGF